MSVKDLDVSFLSYRGIVHALQGVNVDVNYGETVGLEILEAASVCSTMLHSSLSISGGMIL